MQSDLVVHKPIPTSFKFTCETRRKEKILKIFFQSKHGKLVKAVLDKTSVKFLYKINQISMRMQNEHAYTPSINKKYNIKNYSFDLFFLNF